MIVKSYVRKGKRVRSYNRKGRKKGTKRIVGKDRYAPVRDENGFILGYKRIK
jgi:hypothetical protein